MGGGRSPLTVEELQTISVDFLFSVRKQLNLVSVFLPDEGEEDMGSHRLRSAAQRIDRPPGERIRTYEGGIIL